MIHNSKSGNRVVITGIGMVNPIGLSWDEVWGALLQGKCGFSEIPPEHVKLIGRPIYGKVNDNDLIPALKNRRSVKYMGKDALLSVKPAGEALKDAQWESIENAKEEIALYVATGIVAGCNEETMEFLKETQDENGFSIELFAKNILTGMNPLTLFTTMSNMAVCHISMDNGLVGENFVFTSRTDQCASAVAEAFYGIKAGDIKYALVGGTESRLNLEGIASTKIEEYTGELAGEEDFTDFGSKPFDKTRKGVVPAEGASFLFMETYESAIKRGAKIYAEVVGYGHGNFRSSCEESVIEGSVKAVDEMLRYAGEDVNAIDLVISSASSSVKKDRYEGKALERVLGNSKASVWCPKANYGELGVSSFSTAVGLAALAISKGEMPPRVGTSECEFDLKLTEGKIVSQEINSAMVVTFDSPQSSAAILLRRI